MIIITPTRIIGFLRNDCTEFCNEEYNVDTEKHPPLSDNSDFEDKKEDFSWSHFLHMLFISVQDRSPFNFNISSVPIQSRKCMKTLKFALWMHSEWALL